MKIFELLLFTLLVILNLGELNAQIDETYFSLTDDLEGGRVITHLKSEPFIIVGGNYAVGSKIKASVSKMDTLGNVIWSTVTNDNGAYSASQDNYVSKLFQSDSSIYALSRFYVWPNTHKKIWKINVKNGSIIWRKDFYANYSKDIEHFMDYDSTKFLIGYHESSGKTKYAFLDKLTGDTLSTHSIGNGSSNKFALAADANKDLYYTRLDSIFKVSGSNLNNIIWAKALPSTSNIVDYLNFHIDTNNNLYLFGRYHNFYSTNGKGKVVKINPFSGNYLWEANAWTGEIQSVKWIDQGGYLYSAWRHAFVGGGNYDFWTSKVHKTTGTVLWNKAFSFTGLGTPDIHSGNGDGPMSMDVDNQGDAYLTGYYGDANYGPEAWGIVKLDGATGSDIYQLTITEDSAKYDDISVGMAACVINNKPYFLGDLQTFHTNYQERRKPAFIKLDPDSGSVVLKKYFGGEYQYASKTVGITKYPNGQTLVLKQLGRYVQVEMLDFNERLLWSKSLVKNGKLLVGNLDISSNGEIVLSAYTQVKTTTYPFYNNNTDSMYVFYLDHLGNLMTEYAFHVGISGATPVDLLCTVGGTYIFYQRNNFVSFRKISPNSISGEQNINIQYYDYSGSRFVIDQNSSSLLAFGFRNSNSQIIEINKSTLNSVNLATIPAIRKIYYATKSGNVVFLSGSDLLNNDILVAYDVSLLDTLWTKSYSTQSKLYKMVFDTDSSHVYAIGTTSDKSIVGKIKTNNGRLSWLYVHNRTGGIRDQPMDIAYDSKRLKVIVSGNELNTSGKFDVFIDEIDTSGNLIKNYLKQGDFAGFCSGLCNAVLPNGATWVGGQLNHNPEGQAGFIYKLDSVLTFQSTIYDSTCTSYISPSGKFIWDISGQYKDTITSAAAPDTIYLVNLNINGPDTSVFLNNYILTSSDTAASYQWLDCNNSFTTIPGETNRTFKPTVDGSYAVQLTLGQCIDTSLCYVLSGVSLKETDLNNGLEFYPNPTHGKLYLSFKQEYKDVLLIQSNLSGQIINNIRVTSARDLNIDIKGPPGVYFLTLRIDNEIIKRLRVIKN